MGIIVRASMIFFIFIRVCESIPGGGGLAQSSKSMSFYRKKSKSFAIARLKDSHRGVKSSHLSEICLELSCDVARREALKKSRAQKKCFDCISHTISAKKANARTHREVRRGVIVASSLTNRIYI